MKTNISPSRFSEITRRKRSGWCSKCSLFLLKERMLIKQYCACVILNCPKMKIFVIFWTIHDYHSFHKKKKKFDLYLEASKEKLCTSPIVTDHHRNHIDNLYSCSISSESLPQLFISCLVNRLIRWIARSIKSLWRGTKLLIDKRNRKYLIIYIMF